MSPSQITLLAILAVLMFWSVGAYNRLVTLRNRIAESFGPVDAQVRQRHTLLTRWLAAMPLFVEQAPQAAAAVEAAAAQLLLMCDALRARPSAARPAVSLRLAEETLTAARARFSAELPARPELLAGLEGAVLAEELAAADSTLGFARQQFNDATRAYNAAIHQFPTGLIAGTFRFHEAGTL